jgi:uncharacterized membrane protein
MSLAVLVLSLPWFGLSLLIRAAAHGYKGLEPWELTLDVVLAATVTMLALAGVALAFLMKVRSRALIWCAVVAVSGAAAELFIVWGMATVWGSRL